MMPIREKSFYAWPNQPVWKLSLSYALHVSILIRNSWSAAGKLTKLRKLFSVKMSA